MKNFIQSNEVMKYSNSGSAISSGSVVVIGEKIGVAASDIAGGSSGSVRMTGVFELAKKSADTLTQGAKIYWDATAGNITTTSTDNTVAGIAWEAAGSSVTTCLVSINH